MNNKTILYNLNTFPVIGNTVPLVNKMSYWQKSGYSVTVFGSRALIGKIKKEKFLLPFKAIEIVGKSESNNKIRFMIECLRRNLISLSYLKKIEERKFAVVYTISSVLDLVFIPFLLKVRKNKFLWLTVFDNTVPFTGAGNKLIRFLNWFFFSISIRLIKKADRVFAPSGNVRSYLESRHFPAQKIIPTCGGIEVDLIKKAKKMKGIKIDALYIGRINEAKGIYELLNVLALVKKKIPNFQLAIMGNGEETTVIKFKDRIQKMGLSDNVFFLGYKEGQEKFDIIKSSKSFWFFSEAEGFPQVIMEAVSSGLRCFVYCLPAYDYYKNNELIIFKQKDYKSVAKAVIALFNKKDFENKAGAALLMDFSWKRIAKLELESIINR